LLLLVSLPLLVSSVLSEVTVPLSNTADQLREQRGGGMVIDLWEEQRLDSLFHKDTKIKLD